MASFDGPKTETEPPSYFTAVQPPGEPRDISEGERFEPLPELDVLLSSPHRYYLTVANRAYNRLKPLRSGQLNVEAEVKQPLRETLAAQFGDENMSVPTFWIGASKVGARDHWWKPGTMRTFAIGKMKRKCYTVYEATDVCIIEENHRNGRGTKRRTADQDTRNAFHGRHMTRTLDENSALLPELSSAGQTAQSMLSKTIPPMDGSDRLDENIKTCTNSIIISLLCHQQRLRHSLDIMQQGVWISQADTLITYFFLPYPLSFCDMSSLSSIAGGFPIREQNVDSTSEGSNLVCGTNEGAFYYESKDGAGRSLF